MKMDSKKIDYAELSERGLRDLINQDDDIALEEFTKRVKSGQIKRKVYNSFDAFEKAWNERKKAS